MTEMSTTYKISARDFKNVDKPRNLFLWEEIFEKKKKVDDHFEFCCIFTIFLVAANVKTEKQNRSINQKQ